MDVHEARRVLEVADGDGWDTVRASYRRLIRAAHPDRKGGTTRAAVRLNEAYAVLSRARRHGSPVGTGAQPAGAGTSGAAGPERRRPAPPAPPPPPRVGTALVGEDTLLLAAPPPEALALLLEAGHRIGSVSYVDRSCGIFEVVVHPSGETCSLLVTLQGLGHGTEVTFAMESLERAASLSPEPYARRLAEMLG
ncbi:MAG TPA: J domain-containing protein [Acidimicrobiales bacterium]|nr:J domain-containing protein [Acidimicrobiales bacterium]